MTVYVNGKSIAFGDKLEIVRSDLDGNASMSGPTLGRRDRDMVVHHTAVSATPGL